MTAPAWFAHGRRLAEALHDPAAFRDAAHDLGVSPLQAHDLARVARALSRLAAHAGLAPEEVARQAAGISLPKLAMIAGVLERHPEDGAYWLDLAESLAIQDLDGPVREALKGGG